MDEQTKQYLVIGLAVVCLLGLGVRFFRGGGSANIGDEKVTLMCTSCGGFEISADDDKYREARDKYDLETPTMLPGQILAMECPKCGQKSCYQAQKCEKCGNIFVSGQARDPKYLDRCPQCGVSMIEERQTNR